MAEKYLIRNKKTGLYFGWRDTDICLAPIDKPHWFDNPHFQRTSDYWLDEFTDPKVAQKQIESNSVLYADCEVVKVTTEVTPVID